MGVVLDTAVWEGLSEEVTLRETERWEGANLEQVKGGPARRREQQVQRPGGRSWPGRLRSSVRVGGGSVSRDELRSRQLSFDILCFFKGQEGGGGLWAGNRV